jgi:hypothetical protein
MYYTIIMTLSFSNTILDSSPLKEYSLAKKVVTAVYDVLPRNYVTSKKVVTDSYDLLPLCSAASLTCKKVNKSRFFQNYYICVSRRQMKNYILFWYIFRILIALFFSRLLLAVPLKQFFAIISVTRKHTYDLFPPWRCFHLPSLVNRSYSNNNLKSIKYD